MRGLKQIRVWVAERDKALATLDVKEFRKFYERWQRKGIYIEPFPNEAVAEIAMYKAAFAVPTMPNEVKEKAAEWLVTNGYATAF